MIPQDKLLHFLTCYFLASFMGWWALIPAIGKEVYDFIMDKRNKRAWRWQDSIEDLLCDLWGIALWTIRLYL